MSRFGFLASALLAVSASALVGCSTDAPSTTTQSAAPSGYLVESEPAGAVGVGTAREAAKDDEEVIVVGRIGGSTAPFVDGLAAFTIVDPKVPYCADDEGCPTPWDYCCTPVDQMTKNTATVKFVDAAGAPLTEDARKLLGVKELNEVVVQGKADRDDAGNLVVLAEKVYVRK
ncbi:MAG TPA: hypothetical protein VGN57_15550 [Pirellulaceae bacterium]|jgi:hypothetical protein|nr:hypothetical protein [Pirellulaceae bacterium]